RRVRDRLLRLSRLPRRHHQGHAAGAQPRDGTPLRDPYAADVDRQTAIFALAHEIGGDALLEVLGEDTHTCYLGDPSQRHGWGYGCGTCPACRLRADGFAKWMSTR